MTTRISELTLENVVLDWLADLGYMVSHGPSIAPEEPGAERESYDEVLLLERLHQALTWLNPDLPPSVINEALRKVTLLDSPSLTTNNRAFHRMLVDGVEVEHINKKGRIVGDRVRLVDFDNPDNNDWLAVDQFTVTSGQINRRPDIVLFVNGIPLVVIELKNPTNEEATIWTAFNQLQTYKNQIPALFAYNEVLLVSDGLTARFGSLTADQEWFLPWRTIEGESPAPPGTLELEVLLRGIFEKRRFLDYLRYFIVFEEDRGKIAKKLAGYHQFHAVNQAVESTLQATIVTGNRRAGVIWHTQGSGKSLTMAFYAGRVVLDPAMGNPTLVVITDRNDLDDQLFNTFSRCKDLLRQNPIQAEKRAHLHKLLQVASGGVVFSTIQKFLPEEKGERFPVLSERRNIIVIVDEAHRSQYSFESKLDASKGHLSYGFAQNLRDALPNASFIGFTGTPIELTDRNTRAVFGDYISIYDIQQAVQDGATVPIYYESRMAKLDLKEEEIPNLDPGFEEVTEGEEETVREKLKSKWAQLEAIVGTEKRLDLIAKDLIDHFERRLEAMQGKAMVVSMSRRICVDLYSAIVKLRPEWHSDNDEDGAIKVVMTGSATDPVDWQQHVRSKARREAMALRFKDPSDPLQIVIVRDMWLTGFDVPSLHTMYVDKPMRGHGLMQAIARVNRVFKDKPGGLIVDYLGLADQLKQAMGTYTASGGRGNTALDQEEAVAVMLEKYEICVNLFHGFDYSLFVSGTPVQRLALLPGAQEHILAQEQGKERLVKVVNELSKAFALAVPHEEAIRIRDEVAFFQAVRVALVKATARSPRADAELDQAVKQIVSNAIAPDQIVDVFAMAGLQKPDISILSEEFLAEVRELPQRNLAVELLQKLLNDEIKVRGRKNVVQARSFAEMLERAMRVYHNRSIETAQVIMELIELARQMREADRRGENLGLAEDELAFYDALEVNDSAVAILGDDVLRRIAQELVTTVRKNTTIDWTVKDSVRAKLRTMVKRILRKYGYPPDKQEKATRTVLEQAELLCAEVA
ncbi:type I restriction endonuclease subunit R [candidate division WWE3 bacterium]|uniref:Type I restriction enzyme endonuclease subunit n=1 Tax=candidate division WWE3 bacterium TaxID=2053526 RepID=A0A3A4ZBL3_UNCKA|nr:MAG: type I restriction endonuclease subunit R [candidate division WWE3 bacterium]